MKIIHLGTQLINFTPAGQSDPVDGCKIHYYFDDDNPNWIGYSVANIFIRHDNLSLYQKACSMVPGTDYNLIFDFNGRRAVLTDIIPLDD